MLGEIQFLQFPDQDKCSSGDYLHSVLDVLRAAKAPRLGEFQPDDQDSKGGSMPRRARRYHASAYRLFPVELASQDLAWLVTETLPHSGQLHPEKRSRLRRFRVGIARRAVRARSTAQRKSTEDGRVLTGFRAHRARRRLAEATRPTPVFGLIRHEDVFMLKQKARPVV